MSTLDLVKAEFATPQGPVWLWGRPGGHGSDRPVVIAVTGSFASPETLSRLPAVIADDAECVIMRMPGRHAPALHPATVQGVAAALSATIGQAFPGRPIVLAGVADGALTALAVRHPQVRRVVAVEPPLAPAKLWPLLPGLRRTLLQEPDAAPSRAMAETVFGVTASDVREIRHDAVLRGLPAQADVLVGEAPLMPQRRTDEPPSFVDDPERSLLEATPGITLHVVPSVGHDIIRRAPQGLLRVLRRAIRLAAEGPALRPAGLALLARTPAAARRVRYVGPERDAFERACRARNPAVSFEAAPPWEALALDDLELIAAEPQLLDGLAPEGVLAALIPSAAEAGARLHGLEAMGLEILQLHPARPDADTFDDRAGDLAAAWRAGRLADAAPPGELVATARRRRAQAPPMLGVCFVAFVPRLMDIRTRLPTHALRTEPELRITYQHAPFNIPPVARNEPKVMVLQRPALVDPLAWSRAIRRNIQDGWIVVMEHDDHPELVAEVTKRPVTEDSWRRYGYVHGVQTSTEALAEAFGRYNPETRVFPNAAFTLEPFPEAPPPRVFYGAVSRGVFAVEVAKSLGPAIAEAPETEFVVMGDRAVFEALPTDRKRFVDFMPFDDYLRLMGTCAVSLSPIEGRRHQETKSDAKFLDAASRGVLTIASPVIYGRVIRHGETGLIAERVADWAPLLAHAMRDLADQRRMARNAWDYVRERRMFADQVRLRRDWYRELWDRREALNAAVLERLAPLP